MSHPSGADSNLKAQDEEVLEEAEEEAVAMNRHEEVLVRQYVSRQQDASMSMWNRDGWILAMQHVSRQHDARLWEHIFYSRRGECPTITTSDPAEGEDDNEVQLSVAGSSRDAMSAIVANVLAAGAAEESGDIDFGRGNDDDSSEEQDFHEALTDEPPSGVPAGPFETRSTSFAHAASERKSMMENRWFSVSTLRPLTRSNIEIEEEFYTHLQTFHSGLKQKIAENDQNDGRREKNRQRCNGNEV
eukprot:scaffold8733_cov52-Attheya_sp.AAC.3